MLRSIAACLLFFDAPVLAFDSVDVVQVQTAGQWKTIDESALDDAGQLEVLNDAGQLVGVISTESHVHAGTDYEVLIGPDIDNQKLFPGVALDLLDCFSQVTAKFAKPSNDEYGRSTLEYFLFMGSNLAAARGGEIVPYDHDMDIAIDYKAQNKTFTEMWRHPQAIAAYMEEFPSCNQTQVKSYLACPTEDPKKQRYIACTGTGCQGYPSGGKMQVDDNCHLHQFGSDVEGGTMMDVWDVPIPDDKQKDQACHWGTCMTLDEVFPTKSCELRSTPLGRTVSTRCLQEPASYARFYSNKDASKFFRSAGWEQPKYNFWNGKAWQWCDKAFDEYKAGTGALYVYGDDIGRTQC